MRLKGRKTELVDKKIWEGLVKNFRNNLASTVPKMQQDRPLNVSGTGENKIVSKNRCISQCKIVKQRQSKRIEQTDQVKSKKRFFFLLAC